MIPINAFLLAYLAIYVFGVVADLLIETANARHLKKHGKDVPDTFKGMIDADKLSKIIDYTTDKTNLSVVSTIVGKITLLVIVLSGLLPWLAKGMQDVYFVVAGLIFLAVPSLLSSIVHLPFGYFHIFVIEERYGFNTRTLRIWLSDLLKALLISVILGGVLLSLLLITVEYAGSFWWIWAWLAFFCFQLLMLVLYPTLIAPIFNKFTPLDDSELSGKVRHLAEREGLRITGIFQMDAARRSRHTNAYLSGLGKTKRIVLFDTLIGAHEDEEILAVLAHEMGHLKRRHMIKQLLATALASIVLFYLASIMIKWDLMYQSFGFTLMPTYAGLFLVGVLWEPVGFFLSPLGMAISRRFEREADRHACEILKTPKSLIEALKKMARDNLSNLRPYPLYVWFNYSHPPLLERIRELERMA